jgi:ADP-dependent NAD(P)H-hydrate dehydratase / NAD(P)H-hydrate epimerase
MKVVSVEQMRAVEQAAVDLGASLDELQRNAAGAVADELERMLRGTGSPLLFLAGRGNNGRDALIAAAIMRDRGHDVAAYLAPGAGSDDVVRRLLAGGARVHLEQGPGDHALLREWVEGASAIVDGLLGIGIRGEVREPVAGIITVVAEACARFSVPVVAVDLPSGIDADTGGIAGVALPADCTVSLGCVKEGVLKFPAAGYAGRLLPVGIGLPRGSDDFVHLHLILPEEVRKLIPARPPDAHKGRFGRVLVVAGSRRYVGAAYLAGAAAARIGCGLVTLAVPEWQQTALATLLPEATYLPLPEAASDEDAVENIEAVAEMLAESEALVVGPGLGQGPSPARLVRGVLEANERGRRVPCVVDADALNVLAGWDGWWEAVGAKWVLTPHPGEMARLTGLSIAEVNAQRWDLTRSMAARWGQTVLLKGAHSVVADASGSAWINPHAISALASGGTGDVLAGMIAGLMAQGAKPIDAARAGVYLHGEAALRVLESKGTDRLLASDLLPTIPQVVASVAQGSEY